MKQSTIAGVVLATLLVIGQIGSTAAQEPPARSDNSATAPASGDRSTGPTNPNPNPTSELPTSGQQLPPGNGRTVQSPEPSIDGVPRPGNAGPPAPAIR